VQTRTFNDGDNRALQTLMGVPGILLNPDQPLNPDNIDSPIIDGWAGFLDLPASDTPHPALGNDVAQQQSRLWRARLVEATRPEHWDGRYFTFMADLASDMVSVDDPNNVDPAFRLYPLSVWSDPSDRLDESAWRMSRMANLVTTRSDVFEIVVTAQAGYLADDSFYDEDGNPQTPNWRSDNFVVQAETKTRTVYER